MNKIIGLLTAWGAERWARVAAEQALEYCDEVLAVVSPYVPSLRRFEDNTRGILSEHGEIRLLDYESRKATVSEAVADVLNHMLRRSTLREPGNWVWILDADEFYSDHAPPRIRSAIESGLYDQVTAESKFFMVNMRHYLEETGNRLFKIGSMDEGFIPTNKWSQATRRIFILPRGVGMFHYGMLASAEMYRMKWQVEYPHKSQADKVRWLDKIYARYNLADEEHWLTENVRVCGIRSPWFNRGFVPDANGRLFKYMGKHPKFIERTGLTKIEDFRKGAT